MDFNDTQQQAEFRAEIRQWLSHNATRPQAATASGDMNARYASAKAWYKKKAAAGYASLDWPKEYGGAGLTAVHKVIWSQEVEPYDEADDYFVIGIGNCGPAVQHYCSEQQCQQMLPRMASAEDVWCQLFSEPSAGSDVAGLRTSAKQSESGDWLINGQKTWTSGAQHSDYGVILCRTDPSVSKYKGLSMFIIDMRQAGVTVQPIKQMDRGEHFNEVFFNDAVIPDENLLGEVGAGWQAALVVLMNERMAITGSVPNGFSEFLDYVSKTELAGVRLSEHPLVRERLAYWYTLHAGVKASYYRLITAVSQGGMPGAQGAIGKLIAGKMNQDIADFTLQLMGQTGAIHDQAISPQQGYFQDASLYSASIRLAGGTDEIMRNIIAEQVLGLPQEPRADKGMAFADIPTGQ